MGGLIPDVDAIVETELGSVSGSGPQVPARGSPWAILHRAARSVRRGVGAFLEPVARERRAVNRQRRDDLAPHLKGPEQILGLSHHSCGATHGVMERCDFACTSCYLDKAANATPPLPAAEVRHQLDVLRAFLGPQGKAQITSGEVTLLPREVLGGYVRYAKRIGLDPMIMTHGQRLLDQPKDLEDLVRLDGLEKISIHVDVTQRGRREWRPGLREQDLHPVRGRYAQLIRRVRAQTGRTLHAAHTVTVTSQNLDDVAEVVRWVKDHADAFRMVSFQPAAEVGRTQDQRVVDLTLDGIWERICDGLGRSLNRHAMHFGHAECHIMSPLVIVRCADQQLVLETARRGASWDRVFLRRVMRGIGGYSTRGRTRVENVFGVLGLVARNPRLLVESPLYALYRMWHERGSLAGIVGGMIRGHRLSVRPLAIVVHKFMSPDELDTDIGRERLAACVFQVPVENRMVPMCQLNATPMRGQINRAMKARAGESKALDSVALL